MLVVYVMAMGNRPFTIFYRHVMYHELEQGRFTFRHDSCLRTINDFLSGKLHPGFEIFSDLASRGSGPNWTIPFELVPTAQRPDLVVLNRTLKQVVIFELTVLWDKNVDNAHEFKMNKYAALVHDLQGIGYVVDLYCFEVSVQGQITKANKARLKSLIHRYTDAGRSGFNKFDSNNDASNRFC